MSISTNYVKTRQEIPKNVTIVLSVKTRTVEQIEEAINAGVIDMKYPSMGMTNSYRVAIEEGSKMVRIGTAIFGERNGR